MDKSQINKIEQIIDYTFKEKKYIERAFTHASYANQHNLRSYDRLEFFGDSILGFVITDTICKIYINSNQGQLTNLKKTLVSTKPLASFMRKRGLDKFIVVSKATQITDKICEDVFEAIIAAIYLDSNSMDEARRFVLSNYDEELFEKTPENLIDYKSKVLEKYGVDRIEFKTIKKKGQDHMPIFTIALFLDGKEVARANASNKITAEQICAHKLFSIELE